MTRDSSAVIQVKLTRRSAISLAQQLADGIARHINQGEIRPGERLPSVRRMAADHALSHATVVEGYESLMARGMITSRRGSGFFVARREAADSVVQPLSPATPVIDSSWLLSEVFADDRVPIKAGGGWLPSSLLDAESVHRAERSILRSPGAQQVGYGHPYGYAPLRQYIAMALKYWSLDVTADQVITTHGATQALDLVIRTFVRPGDTVFMEDPGYCNLIAMLNLAGANIIGIPRVQGGVDTDILEKMAGHYRPKLFFTNPILQNPTGTSYSPACAVRVLKLAEKLGFLLVEDDLYRELAQPTDPMLAALDNLEHVIYISGYSKTIAPSLRLGYLVCQPRLARELARTKMLLTLTSSEITERLVHCVLTEGQHRRHVERLTASLMSAHAKVATQLEKAGLQLFAPPSGGMFCWASLDRPGVRATDIADQALQKGVWLAPGEFFCLSGRDRPWFRFNVAYSDVPELFEFFRKL